MTRQGLGFILAGVVLYLLGGQAHIGWIYFFDAAIWSLVLLSAFLPRWSLGALRVEVQVGPTDSAGGTQAPATPVEDDAVEVRLKVSNRGRLSRYLVKVVETCPLDDPATGNRVFLLSGIKGGATVAFSHAAACYRRGRYRSTRVTLETRAPLGLFVHRRSFDLPMHLTVYPASLPMEAAPAINPSWREEGRQARSGEATEFYGSREYSYGDPLRRIHWPNTARLGTFVVKQYEEAAGGPVAVSFESRRQWGQGRETTLEYSVKIAASIARSCGDSQRVLSLLAGPTPLRHAAWLEAMDYLAELTVGDSPALAELASAAEGGHPLVVIVPSADCSALNALPDLASRQGGLVVVLLEGFADGEAPQEALAHLRGGNVEMVRCARGDLKSAITALGRTRAAVDWGSQR